MSKSQKRNGKRQFDDMDKPHHYIKQLKTFKERKTVNRLDNALKSKDVSRLLNMEDSI